MEIKHSCYNLYLKKTFLKMSQKLSSNKACISNDTSKIIKDFAIDVLKNFNKCLQQNKFPDPMEKAKINPVFKKLGNTSKDNYRPISTLSNFTKIFESTFFA